MKFIIIILSLFVFFKTLYYGIYEHTQNNKIAGFCIMILASTSLLFPIITIFFC